jgi:hypothetical protein
VLCPGYFLRYTQSNNVYYCISFYLSMLNQGKDIGQFFERKGFYLGFDFYLSRNSQEFSAIVPGYVGQGFY